MEVSEGGGNLLAWSSHCDLWIRAEAGLAMYPCCKRTQLDVWSRYTTKDGDYQWAQPYTRLYSRSAATGVDNIIKMRRKKNMPVSPRDFIKTFELQCYTPP